MVYSIWIPTPWTNVLGFAAFAALIYLLIHMVRAAGDDVNAHNEDRRVNM